jgi:hypothetical protein
MAGTATNQMQVFRQMSCRIVQAGDYNSSLVLTDASTNYLYQAYLGRATASSSNTVSVFIDDNALAVGTTSTLAGNTNRTWYDGISYALVTPFQFAITNISYDADARSITLAWNSIPRQTLLLPQTFTVLRKASLDASDWAPVATGIIAAGNSTTFTDHVGSRNAAFYRITMP